MAAGCPVIALEKGGILDSTGQHETPVLTEEA